MSAGKTVNGPQESAMTAIAMLVQIRLDLSYTLRLLMRVKRMSEGPMDLAMLPKAFIA